MADHLELPKDKHIASKVLEADRHRREMGAVGRLFGSKENATIYLAEILVVMTLVFAGLVAVFDSALRPDALKAVVAIGTLALGYMFGAANK